MSDYPPFGAGIWHFATYVDRYATDGYGAAAPVIDAIDLAGQVARPVRRGSQLALLRRRVHQRAGQEALDAQRARGHRHHARDLHPRVREGRLHQPRRRRAPRGARPHHRGRRRGAVLRRRLREALAGPGRLGLPVPGRLRRAVEALADGVGQLASENPDLKFVIEYKPREPRVHMSFGSVARPLLGIEKIGLPNVGILLDFGHALFGGESPAARHSCSSTTACSVHHG